MEEFDSVTGDYDFDARRFDSSNNQFIQPDSVIQNVYDPQSLNHYSFERNNPYKYEDETGHVFIVDDTILVITALTAVTITALVTNLVPIVGASIPPNLEQAFVESFQQYIEVKTSANTLDSAYDVSQDAYDFYKSGWNEEEGKELLKSSSGLIIDEFIGTTFNNIGGQNYENTYGSVSHSSSFGNIISDYSLSIIENKKFTDKDSSKYSFNSEVNFGNSDYKSYFQEKLSYQCSSKTKSFSKNNKGGN